ncbi:MAG: hypothetical protein JW748_03330 [Anaerolineales bacterium]|nr:hypothetical protein [Anaerolineales bacterium]
MIALIVLFILTIGALATYFLPPQRRNLQIAVALVPAAALAALFLRLPIPDSFSISWSPAGLFPDPLEFRASASSVSFAVYFCSLLLLIVWTRLLRQSPGRTSRLVIYLLIMAGIAACFASTPLAVIIAWSLIDLLSFLAMLFLKSPVEIGTAGISSSLSHSMGVLTINMLGNILVVFSLFVGSPGAGSDWGVLWGVADYSFAAILFLAGLLLRMLLSPLQFAFLRPHTSFTGTEMLLRIVSPAACLCLLANIWPSQPEIAFTGWSHSWPIIPLAVVLLAAGWHWCISASPLGRRDVYFLILPGYALLSSLAFPFTPSLFAAAGGLLILGGGIILAYIGFLPHRRWMAAFPVLLGVFLSGVPFSPASIWSSAVYPGLLNPSGLPVLVPLLLCQIFVVCAVFRLAFDPVDAFPPNEPVFLFVFSAGMIAALFGLLYPAWNGIVSAGSIVFPLLVLGGGIWMVFFVRRVHRTGATLFFRLEKIFRFDWLQRSVDFTFQKASILVSGMEAFLSGEGAMLWSLGIALLLYLVFRGG